MELPEVDLFFLCSDDAELDVFLLCSDDAALDVFFLLLLLLLLDSLSEIESLTGFGSATGFFVVVDFLATGFADELDFLELDALLDVRYSDSVLLLDLSFFLGTTMSLVDDDVDSNSSSDVVVVASLANLPISFATAFLRLSCLSAFAIALFLTSCLRSASFHFARNFRFLAKTI